MTSPRTGAGHLAAAAAYPRPVASLSAAQRPPPPGGQDRRPAARTGAFAGHDALVGYFWMFGP